MDLCIKELQKLCSPEKMVVTLHAAKRLEQRNLTLQNVIDCIMSGEIIEQYPDDYPYPSCLILGKQNNQVPLHAVIASNEEELFIITAYYPSEEQWEDDLKTRKEQQK